MKQHAEDLLIRDSRVVAVGLFGSVARGKATPRSDADILIVLRIHSLRRWFDRIPEYSVVFQAIGLPVELFPYTLEELTQLLSRPGFLRTILSDMVPLAGDPKGWKYLQNGQPIQGQT